jgi:hypothetical protein
MRSEGRRWSGERTVPQKDEERRYLLPALWLVRKRRSVVVIVVAAMGSRRLR